MENGWTKRIEELEAENKRLRELVDGATEVVEISNFTFPAQREWKAAWLKKAAKAMKDQMLSGVDEERLIGSINRNIERCGNWIGNIFEQSHIQP